MNIALSVVGALVFIGAGYAVARRLRAIGDTNRSDTYFSCMWLWFGAWVGLILVVPNTFDLVTRGQAPPSWVAIVVVLALVVSFAGFGIAGLLARWGQFRDLRRQCIEMGTTPPPYSGKPWAITGWTLAAVVVNWPEAQRDAVTAALVDVARALHELRWTLVRSTDGRGRRRRSRPSTRSPSCTRGA